MNLLKVFSGFGFAAAARRATAKRQSRHSMFRCDSLIEFLERKKLLSTFAVTQTNGDGDGSLTKEITLATAAGSGNVVQLDCNVTMDEYFTETIPGAETLVLNSNSGSYTITEPPGTVLSFTSSGTNKDTLNFTDLNFSIGYTTGGLGVIFTGSGMTGNMSSITMTGFQNSVIAQSGATANVTNSEIDQSPSTGTGILISSGSTGSATTTNFENNSGVAIENAGSFTATSDYFDRNEESVVVYSQATYTNVKTSTFTQDYDSTNTLHFGGEVNDSQYPNSGVVSLTGDTFELNTAPCVAVSVDTSHNPSISVNGNTFYQNYYGGLYVSGSGASTVGNNTFNSSTSATEPEAEFVGGAVTLEGNQFQLNDNSNSAVTLFLPGSAAATDVILYNTWYENNANGVAPGILSITQQLGDAAHIQECTFVSNTVTDGDGGAIEIQNQATGTGALPIVRIAYDTITANGAYSNGGGGYGGGIFFDDTIKNAQLTVGSSIVAGNTATAGNVAVYTIQASGSTVSIIATDGDNDVDSIPQTGWVAGDFVSSVTLLDLKGIVLAHDSRNPYVALTDEVDSTASKAYGHGDPSIVGFDDQIQVLQTAGEHFITGAVDELWNSTNMVAPAIPTTPPVAAPVNLVSAGGQNVANSDVSMAIQPSNVSVAAPTVNVRAANPAVTVSVPTTPAAQGINPVLQASLTDYLSTLGNKGSLLAS